MDVFTPDPDRFESQPARRRRNGTEIVVAADRSSVLRRGDPAVIAQELGEHQSLLARGYPVARILDSGPGWHLEEHLGEPSLAFTIGAAAPGSPERADAFGTLLSLLRRYASAQAAEETAPIDPEELFATLGVDRNLPWLDAAVEAASRTRMADELARVPGLRAHGDFSAWNVHPGGVIDFEDAFLAPVPYDLVCAIVSPDAFTTTEERPGFEYPLVYAYTQEERAALMEIARGLAGADAERIIPACAVLRWHWLLRDMDHAPVTQAFRAERTAAVLHAYAEGSLTTDALVTGIWAKNKLVQ